MPPDLDQYESVQTRTKSVLRSLGDAMSPHASEASIAAEASRRLAAVGLKDTWYHGCQALVLADLRSATSVPGAKYLPSKESIGDNTIVTVDLSPIEGSVWGDCARSFYLEDGAVTTDPRIPELKEGCQRLAKLHSEMREFVTVDTTFRLLHEFANDLIRSFQFENLDFRDNVGHSIEKRLSDRQFIDSSTVEKLSSVAYFTFEPHIRKKRGKWGFKHEEIYYFDDCGSIVAL